MKDRKLSTVIGEVIAMINVSMVAVGVIGLMFRVICFVWYGY